MIGAGLSYIVETVFQEGLSTALRRVMHARARVAKEIFLDELRRGAKAIEDVGDVDEAAAMVFRFARAGQEGTARSNLRIMAQVLVGTLQQRPIYADEFLRWADVIANLRREEIILATTFHRHWKIEQTKTEDSNKALWDAETATKAELIGADRVFVDQAVYARNMTALARTGLVRIFSQLSGIAFVPSDLMDDLVRLTRIEDALNEPRR